MAAREKKNTDKPGEVAQPARQPAKPPARQAHPVSQQPMAPSRGAKLAESSPEEQGLGSVALRDKSFPFSSLKVGLA